jgi:hypothetical protein
VTPRLGAPLPSRGEPLMTGVGVGVGRPGVGVGVGMGRPGVAGAGAPNTVCASCCSGAGRAPATAVPDRAMTTAITIPVTATKTRRADGSLRVRVLLGGHEPGAVAARTNAATAASSPDSSCSVPGRDAALNTSSRDCWAAEASGPGSCPLSSRSAIASSSDSRSARREIRRARNGTLAREPEGARITLRLPGQSAVVPAKVP